VRDPQPGVPTIYCQFRSVDFRATRGCFWETVAAIAIAVTLTIDSYFSPLGTC